MYRGGGKRENDVIRQARVKQHQIELDEQFKILRRRRDTVLETDTFERCTDMMRKIQAKHAFLAYPERGDYIKEQQETLHRKRLETSELRDEVSRQEAEILRQNHPAILEVTDVTRATKLAEKLFDLYTIDWSDLFDDIRGKVSDKVMDQTIHGGLRDIMKLCYETCVDLCTKQRLGMFDVLHMGVSGIRMKAPLELRLKASQKDTSPFTLGFVYKVIKTEIVNSYSPLMKRLQLSPYKTPLVEYLERYTELCWYSQIRDPPVAMEFSLLSDQSLYEPFTQKGPSLDYIVWPVLFLYKNGPLLAKGVAMFTRGIYTNKINFNPEDQESGEKNDGTKRYRTTSSVRS